MGKDTVSKGIVRREIGMESIVGERLECKVYVGGERKKFM